MSDVPCQATSSIELRRAFMGGRPKSEMEWWAVHHIEQLEKELNEANKELQRSQSMPLYDYAFENGCRAADSKLSAFKAQIESGELVPVDVIKAWCDINYMDRRPPRGYAPLKQFAAERAKEGKHG